MGYTQVSEKETRVGYFQSEGRIEQVMIPTNYRPPLDYSQSSAILVNASLRNSDSKGLSSRIS